jgi:phenylpropionate dioxygenase-like ring-hydroxylating dioxygenase large terminal subunit
MRDKRPSQLPPYTRGWFQLGWSNDLKVGQIKKVRQFGQTFTLFRGEDGAAGLIDDLCPHLGAHFSDGGSVQGNSVRCPYHHWCFDRAGACTQIPYSKKIPVKARVKSYRVVERYGMIFVYRDQEGTAPSYDLPQLDGFDESLYEEPATYEFTIRTHSQDIMENSVDSAHFRAVHGHNTPENNIRTEGNKLRITQVVTVRRFGTELKSRLEFHMVEPGFHYVHFPEIVGTRAFLFSSITPIDEVLTNHRLSVWINKTSIPGWSRIVRRFVLWQMMKTYHEDMRIWEGKEYLAHPVLCDGDGAIIQLRRWYSQFFETKIPGIAAEL